MRSVAWLACTLALAAPSRAGAWERLVTGEAAGGQAMALATDVAHDVVVGGFVVNTASGEDAVVVKLSGADGATLWRWERAGAGDGTDRIDAVAIDPASGDVIAAGRIATDGGSRDALVVKLPAGGGAERWIVMRSGDAGTDEALAVAVAANGDVIVAGRLSHTGTGGDFAVLRLAALNGAIVWETSLDGAASADDQARAVAIDGNGDVFAAGRMAGVGTGADFAVVKLDGTSGAERWRRTLDHGANGDVAHALALDGAGNPIAAGQLVGTVTAQDFAVVKLAGTNGAEQWRYERDGGAAGDTDEAFGIALHPSGDAVVAGELEGDSRDFVVVRLSGGGGTEVWQRRLDVSGGRDGAEAVALDSTGDVLAVGRTRNTGSRQDFTVVKVAGASGEVRWQRTRSGAGRAAEVALAVAVDGADDVVAAGSTRAADDESEFSVVKLVGASGGSFPCGNAEVEAGAGEECDDGNLVDGDGCDSNCTETRCGNGILTAGEECDDGNLVDGDGCDSNCTETRCGNGIATGAEECDDGNAAGGDCCTPTCLREPEGAPCSDGSACTLADRCRRGACTSNERVECVPEDDCESSACDPATGACNTTLRPDGRGCNDRNACTEADTCRAGRCAGGPLRDCDDAEPCTDDACDAAQGCTHTEREGFASVSCGFERGLDVSACTGERVPRKVAKRYDRSARQVARAADAMRPAQARRLVKRSARLLRQAGNVVFRAANRGDVSRPCADELATLLGNVQVRAERLRDVLSGR